jgi:hypothetical protein
MLLLLLLLLFCACAGQWVPNCSSLGSMQLLHNMTASCCTAVTQQQVGALRKYH